MYGTKEERLAIGRQVHEGKLTVKEASSQCDVPERRIRWWVKQYKESAGLSPQPQKTPNNVLSNERAAYEDMTKDELINALILAKANELRAKKGYEVKIGRAHV